MTRRAAGSRSCRADCFEMPFRLRSMAPSFAPPCSAVRPILQNDAFGLELVADTVGAPEIAAGLCLGTLRNPHFNVGTSSDHRRIESHSRGDCLGYLRRLNSSEPARVGIGQQT